MSKNTVKCRVCLYSKQMKYKSLFDKYKNFVIFEFINTITNLKIKLNDGFPDKICNSCYLQLKTSINFKQKCEASDIILKSNTKVKEEAVEERKKLSMKTEDSKYDDIKTESDSDDNDGFLTVDVKQDDVKDEKTSECFAYPVTCDNKESNFKSRAIDLKLECHDCGSLFKSKCKLKVHWKNTHMLSSLICVDCKRAFKSYKAFHIHKKKKSKSCAIASNKNVTIEGVGRERIFYCKHCLYKTKRVKDLSSHLVTHSGERPFKCNICSKTYTQLSSLQGHQETAHQKYIVQITCHLCGKFVKGRRKVHRHLRSHTKVQCTVCNKSINKLGFQEHMKRHSGIKSYTCEKCASTFFTTSELCNHKRLVHGKKIFKCDLCEFSASNENLVKKHKIKHSSRCLPCIVCGRFFVTVEKLAAHQRTHYAEKKFKCPQCDVKFYQRDSVRRHLKLKHIIQISEKTEVKIEDNCVPQTEGIE